MYLIGYHGTNQKIDLWDLSHLGKNQGQSIFPGIYFSETYDHAKEFAKLAVEKRGGKPIVYIAEVEIEKPLDLRKNKRVFNSFSEIREFCRKYFPDWFDQEGDLLSYKIDYVQSKLETYSGNYNLIQYAAKENQLDLIEVLEDLGFDSAIDYDEFVITSPQQILSFQEVDHQLTEEELEIQQLPAEESIGERNVYAAFETKSNDYIRSSRNAKPYKTMPGNRFMRRVRIQANGGNNIWFDLDMNRLFKKGSFAVKIPVVGETDQYVVTISFEDWLPYLKQAIATTGFNQLTVKRSLAEMMRFHDLKVRCTCPDFRYRFSYWLTVDHDIEGEPELRPSDETNPHNDLGKGCKHVLFCFTGDTQIRTLDNITQSFVDLEKRFKNGEQLWAYSVDEKGDFAPGKITNVFESGTTDEIIKITLDNGKEIKCTPDHLFMDRNGNWVSASSLIPGKSLMPLYFGKSKKGYETVKLNSRDSYSPTYFRVAHYLYPDQILEKRELAKFESNKGVAIHHKDFNKFNNNPENLEPMTVRSHIKFHSEHGSFTRLWKDPAFRKKYSEVSREFMTNLQHNPTDRLKEARKRQSEKMKNYKWSEESRAKLSRSLKGRKPSEKTLLAMAEANKGKHWYTDGEVDLMAYECPEGFRPGMVPNKFKDRKGHPASDLVKEKAKKSFIIYWNSLSDEQKEAYTEKRLKTRAENKALGKHKPKELRKKPEYFPIEKKVYKKDNSDFDKLGDYRKRDVKRKIKKAY